MIKFSKIYIFSFLIIIMFCFFIGGFVQFFLGVPNIVFTYGVLSVFFVIYILYVAIKKRVFFDRVIGLHFLLILLLLISSIYNKTKIIKTLIYLIFILVPLGSYLFFKINKKERYLSLLAIGKIYLFIACLQLPIILIQKFGYSFFIKFNMSSQVVASFDFMFGTFFLKADHSLGFFILLNIINLAINNENKRLTKYSKIIIAYLTLTVFIAESNITKLLVVLFILYLIHQSFPKKIRIIGLFLILLLIPVGYSQLKKIEAFEREVYFVEREYNPMKSFRNYERGIAKRPQVVISYITKLPLRIIGNGPYSYFNVLKGKFTNTKHFSQLIWAYADLGIIGLILIIWLIFSLVTSLGLSGVMRNIVFVIIIIYAFMTTILSDLAIMITFVSLLQNRKQ